MSKPSRLIKHLKSYDVIKRDYQSVIIIDFIDRIGTTQVGKRNNLKNIVLKHRLSPHHPVHPILACCTKKLKGFSVFLIKKAVIG